MRFKSCCDLRMSSREVIASPAKRFLSETSTSHILIATLSLALSASVFIASDTAHAQSARRSDLGPALVTPPDALTEDAAPLPDNVETPPSSRQTPSSESELDFDTG